MPSHGRWRRSKIVAPLPSRAQEIVGGITNALNRGETLAKAKQTFINGGYKPQEVQAATQLIKSKPVQIAKPLNPSEQTPQPELPLQQQKFSKKTTIILSVIGAVIIIIALVLGLFWDKIF